MTATPNSGGAWHVMHTPGANDSDPTTTTTTTTSFAGSFDPVQPAFIDSPFATTSDAAFTSHFLANAAHANGSSSLSSSGMFDADGTGIAAALNAGLGGVGGLSVEDLRRLLVEQGRGNDPPMMNSVPANGLHGSSMSSMHSLPNGNAPAPSMPWSTAAMSHQGLLNPMSFVNGDAGDVINEMPPGSNGNGQSIPLSLSGITNHPVPGSFGQPTQLAAMLTHAPNSDASASPISSNLAGNPAAMTGHPLPVPASAFPTHLHGSNPTFNGGINRQIHFGANGPIIGTGSSTSSSSTNGSTAVSPLQQHAVQRSKESMNAAKPRSSTIGGSIAGTTRRTKFRRSRTGCMVCRKRKVKCDQDGLPCKQCRIGKRDCHYEDTPPKRRKKVKRASASNAAATSNEEASGEGSQNEEQSSDNGGEDTGSLSTSTPSSTATHAHGNAVPGANTNHSLPQQLMLEKLRAAANGQLSNPFESVQKANGENSTLATTQNLPDGTSDTANPAFEGDDGLRKGASAASDHWSGMSNFAMLGGSDEWNITTPSTGATSVHTADGDHGPSNPSSRRETLSDETLIGDHDGKAKDEGNDAKENGELDSLVEHLTNASAIDADTTIDGKGTWSPLRLDMSAHEAPSAALAMFAEQQR